MKGSLGGGLCTSMLEKEKNQKLHGEDGEI